MDFKFNLNTEFNFNKDKVSSKETSEIYNDKVRVFLEDYYHFEGSMNYSTNNMAEQLLFENNKEIYDNDMQFFNDIVENANNSLEIIN